MDLWEFVNRVLVIGGLPRISSSVPARVAYAAGAMLEFLHKLLRIEREPRITRFLVEELSTAHWFNIGAARRDLNYRPSVTMEQGFALLKASLQNPEIAISGNSV